MKKGLVLLMLLVAAAGPARGQMLRYNQHREVQPREDATLRIGPFYSDLSFTQTAGFRYSRSTGTGTDFLFASNRGVIKEDGWEYPFVSRLTARNYLLVSRHMDLDISFSAGYAFYPMDTQQNEFFFDFADEGISAFLSSEFMVSDFIRGSLSDSIVYRTDYIDVRGEKDSYGGSAYEHLNNAATLDLDWLLAEDRNFGATLSRIDNIVIGDQFSEQDQWTWREQVFYEQQLAAFLVAGARVSFSQTEYESDLRASSSMQEYTAYASARLTERSKSSVSAGYASGSSDNLRGGKTETVSASAGVETQMTQDLSHGVKFDRALRGGFSAPFDISTSLGYFLSYNNDLTKVSFRSAYSVTEPQVDSLSSYNSWITALAFTVPLTRAIDLLCSADYSLRENDTPRGADETEPELTSDYATLSVRVGTSFSVTRKISFSVYGQHIDRTSDSTDLTYSRDIFAGTFTFSHSF